jgi:DNA-binding NarL/FixJ family response regulator
MIKPLRIFIADDHEAVGRGLRQMLEAHSGWEIAGEAVNGREAVEKVGELKPDLVILDISMPELNGFAATRQILKLLPRTEILILSMHESEQVIRDALEAGARGYVLKTDAVRDLVPAVEALSRHQLSFSPNLAEMVLQGYLDDRRADAGKDSLRRLTKRERQILQLLAEGKSNKTIACELEISVKTAVAHRANIMHKLGCDSLSDIVRFAIRANVISD